MQKKIIIASLFVLSFSGNFCFAQNYLNLLTNGSSKTWQLTGLNIAGKDFVDSDSTCVYQITINYNYNGTYIRNTPCSVTPIKQSVFSIVSDSLLFDGIAVKINSITDEQFETSYLSTVYGSNPLQQAVITQKYEAH